MTGAPKPPTGGRKETWSRLGEPCDLLVIGGGITGAGILREATRFGLKALLVEQGDFAWGTSSRSSKQVHGGLRYLRQGNLRLTSESVHERERLLREGPGLVEQLPFVVANYAGDRPGRLEFGAGLLVYDLLAGRRRHRHLSARELTHYSPRVSQAGLAGGYLYADATTDDSRLVLRVIREAVRGGATALNYVAAEELLLHQGRVAGVALRDAVTGHTAEVRARAVINATGIWADRLRAKVGAPARLRPLRGSHLLFPSWRLPAPLVTSILHPRDRRPLFVMPWEGMTILGTTDVDHAGSLDEGPSIGREEADYLMEALTLRFPSLGLDLSDARASFSGIRAVVGTGKADPSKESREHVIWEEEGLVTVTGGKLTTFRLLALDALKAVRGRLPRAPTLDESTPILDHAPADFPGGRLLDPGLRQRLAGRYGAEAADVVAAAREGELLPLAPTPVLPAEIRWAARSEAVVRLDDLLLRRVRLGLLAPEGGAVHFPLVRDICREELGWDEALWEREKAAYRELWKREHGVPPGTMTETAT